MKDPKIVKEKTVIETNDLWRKVKKKRCAKQKNEKGKNMPLKNIHNTKQ